MDEARQQFCDWLHENGACYPKIDWPSTKTVSGIRGGVAKEAIATDEHMIEIPMKLMMSPPIAFADPDVGELLKSVEEMLHGDLLLTVFIMHELRKGEKSFYSPFLRILPEPGNISEWSDEHLALLQDPAVAIKARNRKASMKAMFNRTIPLLHETDPTKFPLEEFTFERFKFAFNSVQARAFGRRLPWTAMVPFADCLNHSNVQTKYDYDVDGNGVFRLFPTGDNHYPQGAEVFNSYGRRANENLLMDYGFSMLDNEWDDVDLCLALPKEEPHFDLRYNALFLVGFNSSRRFLVTDTEIPFKALMFLRIVLMDVQQLQAVVSSIPPSSAATTASSAPDAPRSVRMAAQDSRVEAQNWFSRVFSAQLELEVLTTMRGMLLNMLAEHATSAAQDMCILDWLNARRSVSADADAPADTESVDPVPHDSAASEVDSSVPTTAELTDSLDALTLHPTAARALSAATARLQEALSAELFECITALEVESDAYWRTLSAVQYRLTRKRILIGSVRNLDDLISYFEQVERMLIGEEADNSTSGNSDSSVSAGESCASLWRRCIGDNNVLFGSDTPTQAGSSARRAPLYDYLKRYRMYVRDATNPLHWPELVK